MTQPAFSVFEVSRLLKLHVEEGFQDIMVLGEISGYKKHVSGHHYFTLKDDQAILDAVCWRGTALSIDLKDGMSIVCRGRITTYAGRSKYQMIVQHVQDQGQGQLLQKLEELKEKLRQEGVFNNQRPLPPFPQTLGILTSPTGAVIQDMLHRCRERWPCQILLYPIQVQGTQAVPDILEGIQFFNQLACPPDILVIARGGGSLEDLWAFQDESVVRAVAGSKIPVVTAIGHETDTTLVDYAADLRAPTPTAAIELIVPDRREVTRHIESLEKRISKTFESMAQLARMRLTHAIAQWKRLEQHPDVQLQRVDDMFEKFFHVFTIFHNKKQYDFEKIRHRAMQMMGKDMNLSYQNVHFMVEKLQQHIRQWIQERRVFLQTQSVFLEQLSYRKTLKRGFALVQGPDHDLLSTAQDARKVKTFQVVFQDDSVQVAVQEET